MHVIFSQFSGLVGLLVFLSQLWRYASLEGAAFTAFATGLGVYAVLLVGDLLIRRILATQTPALAGSPSGGASRPVSSSVPRTDAANKAMPQETDRATAS